MRCAIVHYWLLGMRGGEKVVEGLSRLLPEADIYTLFYDPERVSPLIRSRVVRSSFLNPFRRMYRSLLPLMPMALEAFDLRDYDLVISSESGPAKGVLVSSQARHICYCHSPMRYLWDLYPAYLHEWTPSISKRALMMPLTNYLRLWDYASASRVDEFVANSANVQNRIQCVQRTNLIGRRYARWRELGAVKGWEPVQLPLQCEQFKPRPGESDQRTALQRWPNLSTKLSAH